MNRKATHLGNAKMLFKGTSYNAAPLDRPHFTGFPLFQMLAPERVCASEFTWPPSHSLQSVTKDKKDFGEASPVRGWLGLDLRYRWDAILSYLSSRATRLTRAQGTQSVPLGRPRLALPLGRSRPCLVDNERGWEPSVIAHPLDCCTQSRGWGTTPLAFGAYVVSQRLEPLRPTSPCPSRSWTSNSLGRVVRLACDGFALIIFKHIRSRRAHNPTSVGHRNYD